MNTTRGPKPWLSHEQGAQGSSILTQAAFSDGRVTQSLQTNSGCESSLIRAILSGNGVYRACAVVQARGRPGCHARGADSSAQRWRPEPR